MTNTLIRCPEGVWGGQEIPVLVVGKCANGDFVNKKAHVEVPKCTQSGHFFAVKIPSGFFNNRENMIVQNIEIDCAFLRVNLPNLDPLHRFKPIPPEIGLVRATAPNGQIFCAKVPRRHFDKPHFLVPIPRKALLPAQWIAAASQITTPIKSLVKTIDKSEDSADSASGNGIPDPHATPERSENEIEIVPFAWFCNLSINKESHASYLELNEKYGVLSIWLMDKSADETSAPNYKLNLKDVSALSFVNPTQLRMRTRIVRSEDQSTALQMDMIFPNPDSGQKVEERILVSKQQTRFDRNLAMDQQSDSTATNSATSGQGEWKRFYDAAFDRDFFVNRHTRRSTWTSPVGPDPPTEKKLEDFPKHRRQRRGSEWVHMLDHDTGTAFYYNRVTRARSWDAPHLQRACKNLDEVSEDTSDSSTGFEPTGPGTFEYPKDPATLSLHELASSSLETLDGRLKATEESPDKEMKKRGRRRRGSMEWHEEVEDPTLPEGWIALLQDTGTNSRKIFYVNVATSRSQWKHPAKVAPPALPEPITKRQKESHENKPKQEKQEQQEQQKQQEDTTQKQDGQIQEDSWAKYMESLEGADDEYGESANVAGTTDVEWQQRRLAEAAEPKEDLPPGWTSFRDANDRLFFMHNHSRRTSWTRPGSGLVVRTDSFSLPPPPPPPTPSKPNTPDLWGAGKNASVKSDGRSGAGALIDFPSNDLPREEFAAAPKANPRISSAVNRDNAALSVTPIVDNAKTRSVRRTSLAKLAKKASYSSMGPLSASSNSELKFFDKSPKTRRASQIAAAASKNRRTSALLDSLMHETIDASSLVDSSLTETPASYQPGSRNSAPVDRDTLARPDALTFTSAIKGDSRSVRRTSLATLAQKANYSSGKPITPRLAVLGGSMPQQQNGQRRLCDTYLNNRHSAPSHRRSSLVLTSTAHYSPKGSSVSMNRTMKRSQSEKNLRKNHTERTKRRVTSARMAIRRVKQTQTQAHGKFEEGRRVEATKGPRRGQIGILRGLTHVYLKKWMVEWQSDKQRAQYKQTSLRLLPEANRRRFRGNRQSAHISKVAAKFSPSSADQSRKKRGVNSRRLRRLGLSRLAKRTQSPVSSSPDSSTTSPKNNWTMSNLGIFSP